MTRVLIADDHPLVLSGIQAVLRNSAYEVVATVADGEAVFDALPKARPDILILDINMPKRTGMDVLRTLRARNDLRPVMLLTAVVADAQLLEALDLGVEAIGLKDTVGESLIECLDTIRAGRRWIEPSVLQRAIALARDSGKARGGPLAILSARERSIVALVAQGLRNKEIAGDLGMSEGSVKVYVHRIYQKLGVQSRVELAMLARDAGEE